MPARAARPSPSHPTSAAAAPPAGTPVGRPAGRGDLDPRSVNMAAREMDFAPDVPERPGLSDKMRRAVQRSRKYARRALAVRTVDSYTYHWRQFVNWCDTYEVAALPADPVDVATHLSDLADGELDDNEDLLVDETGAVVRPPMAASTIGLRLAAINKAHKVKKLAEPGDDPYCAEMAKAIRKTLGVRPKKVRTPLTLKLLIAVLAECYRPRLHQLRDAALAVVGNHPRLGPAVLAGLDWDRVDLHPGWVTIRLHRRPEHLPGREVTLMADADPLVCPVATLSALKERTGGDGPVFPSLTQSGGPVGTMSDVAVIKAMRRAAVGAGVAERRAGRPWSRAELRHVAARLARRRLIDVRDRAVLLTGFTGAVRRSNLAAFCWGDFTVVDNGLVVLLRKSKTDQEQRGFEIFLPYGRNELSCPVRAWMGWRDRVAELIGGDPAKVAAGRPCFVPLGRGDRIETDVDGSWPPMGDEAVNAVVARRAAAAGLVGNFGGHSVRAGFVTTLAEAGMPAYRIAEQTGHRSLDSLQAYIRPIEARLNNPSLVLADLEDALERDEADGDGPVDAPPTRFAGSRPRRAAG